MKLYKPIIRYDLVSGRPLSLLFSSVFSIFLIPIKFYTKLQSHMATHISSYQSGEVRDAIGRSPIRYSNHWVDHLLRNWWWLYDSSSIHAKTPATDKFVFLLLLRRNTWEFISIVNRIFRNIVHSFSCTVNLIPPNRFSKTASKNRVWGSGAHSS